jgi:hypothetical protein
MISLGRNPRGVGAADERPHAGAGDAVDRNAQVLEHFEDTQVGAAARAAAAERERHPRARGLRAGIERREEQQEDRREPPAGLQTFSEKGVNCVSRS